MGEEKALYLPMQHNQPGLRLLYICTALCTHVVAYTCHRVSTCTQEEVEEEEEEEGEGGGEGGEEGEVEGTPASLVILYGL